jgi:hypothetical protein
MLVEAKTVVYAVQVHINHASLLVDRPLSTHKGRDIPRKNTIRLEYKHEILLHFILAPLVRMAKLWHQALLLPRTRPDIRSRELFHQDLLRVLSSIQQDWLFLSRELVGFVSLIQPSSVEFCLDRAVVEDPPLGIRDWA